MHARPISTTKPICVKMFTSCFPTPADETQRFAVPMGTRSSQPAALLAQSPGFTHQGIRALAFQSAIVCVAESGSVIHTAASEQATHTGTTKITASGNAQLSYRNASTRNTHATERPNTNSPVFCVSFSRLAA